MHDDGTTTFDLWAPRPRSVAVQVGDTEPVPLEQRAHGWWRARVPARTGDRYGFRLDGGELLPDPASRRQPDGVHGPSALFDVSALAWSPEEARWRSAPLAGAVIYELHIGTFTPGGTFDAATERLDAVAALGVTHLEVMPINAFNGERGWGYDGVFWYAAHESYGGPEGFARFVDACHRRGLGVILDVVYNHLGPSGNVLPRYGPYLTDRYATPWGEALNLDGPGADQVRGFIVGNALHWLESFHVDGLRLDATHALIDTSSTHVLAEMADAVADLATRVQRPLELIAETDRQDPATIRPREAGGLGLDGQWCDDLHHGLHVALTGEREGYYADYTGLPDVARSYSRGFVYDGRYSPGRQRTVGAALGSLSSHRLVTCLQNHDQVGNRPTGDRLTTTVDHGRLRAAVLLLLAAPSTPMLFMGEEHGETNPFLYFSGHPEPELAEAVRRGRREEFADFPGFHGEVPDPQDPTTFAASIVDHGKSREAAGRSWRALWADLLALRRGEPALASGRRDLVEVCWVDDRAIAIRRAHPSGVACLVVANLDDAPRELELGTASRESGRAGSWTVRLSTEHPRYGGSGAAPEFAEADGGVRVSVPARAASIAALNRG
ncbi:malto-oligosyltrehalose trehalohydrolase [Egibacter rhizosphaerae]|uniref:malto-oligosyltrehalose trehalohydrolase n=1 Tax=Egibacter rhizosphaerae TaxID=1670831 RepID=UPI0013F178DF|nr:malto-oligosyltrehalose trehalohydrolase [Egibacter rhizosphaerae]